MPSEGDADPFYGGHGIPILCAPPTGSESCRHRPASPSLGAAWRVGLRRIEPIRVTLVWTAAHSVRQMQYSNNGNCVAFAYVQDQTHEWHGYPRHHCHRCVGGWRGCAETDRPAASQNLPAAVFVVLHLPAHGPSVLPRILARLACRRSIRKTTTRSGRDDLCRPAGLSPAGQGRVTFASRAGRGKTATGRPPTPSSGPRPGPMARGSSAWSCPGCWTTGPPGCSAIKRMGGTAVVQHPGDAMYAGMPQSAIDNVPVDYCVPATESAGVAGPAVREPVANVAPANPHPPSG